MKIVYRKSDLQCVGVVVGDMSNEEEIQLNVIPNFGGIEEDYETIESDKANVHLELIDGEVIVVENPTSETPLSEIERLRLEQAQANAEIIELMMSMWGGM